MNEKQYMNLLRQGWRPGQIISYTKNLTEPIAHFALHMWPKYVDEVGEVPPYIYIAHEMAHQKLGHQRSINYLVRAIYSLMVEQEEQAWALVLADFVFNARTRGNYQDLEEVRMHAMAALSTYYEGQAVDRRQKAQDFVDFIITKTNNYISERLV